MTQAVIHNMRGRVEQLREVAKSARDPHVVEIARKMADDIEADIRELTEAQAKQSTSARRIKNRKSPTQG